MKVLKKQDFVLDMHLTPAQREIDEHPARFKVVRAGRQFGKTFWAIYKMICKLGKSRSTVIYVGPTFSQVKRIAWERFKDQIHRTEKANGRKFLKRKPNETELSVQTANGSIGYLLGADNVDIARGLVADHAILEEAAMLDPRIWYEVLRPALLYKKGTADFISTPRGYNWFKDIYDDAISGNFPDWAGFHYTIYDNPFMDREQIDKEKEQCRSEAIWRQEYLAQFEAGGGRVFEEFIYDKHVEENHEPPQGSVIYRGIDFGLRDDTVCLWLYYHAGVIHVFGEHVQANIPASAQAQIIKQKTRHNVKATSLSHDAFRTDPDLKGVNVAVTFLRHGVENLVKSSMNKSEGIDLIRHLLKNNKLKIQKRCPTLIKQLMAYEWSKAVSMNEKTDPTADDDTVDALRYGCQLVDLMENLGVPKKETGEKMYRVGNIVLPLRKRPQYSVRVESDCGKVLIGR